MSRKIKSEPSSQGILLNILAVLVISGSLFIFPVLAMNQPAMIDNHPEPQEDGMKDGLLTFHDNTLSPFHTFSNEDNSVIVPEKIPVAIEGKEYKVAQIHSTTITAYSSTVDQTDSDPFITASGSWVEDGIVAANFLPFNTKIRIPEYFGDRVFVVKDRMNRRHANRVDIWFPSRYQAINFGITHTDIEILKRTEKSY